MNKSMKWKYSGVLALLALLAGVSVAADSDYLSDEELLEEGLKGREEPFEMFLGLGMRTYMFQHSALQTRSDRQDDDHEEWRDGEVDGNGTALQLGIARKTSRIVGTLVASDYDYKLNKPGLEHTIKTERRDFDLTWEELTGESERGRWGWLLGVRYTTLDERMNIRETKDHVSVNDSVTWLLGQAGYWGSIHPFYRDFFTMYGSTRIFIGEADGIARTGSDKEIDGDIEQDYDQEFSVAYGWNFNGGVAMRIRNRVGIHVEYYREWLYSFESVDSGIMVFPDNNDARFIDASHGVQAYVSVIW